MPSSGERSTTILIDGVPTEVIGSSKTTKGVGVLPSDVKPGRMAAAFKSEGLSFEAMNIKIKSKELEALAEDLAHAAATKK